MTKADELWQSLLSLKGKEGVDQRRLSILITKAEEIAGLSLAWQIDPP